MNQFENIIGNEDVKEYFRKALRNNTLAHSYIFEGPSGVGKKTLAIEIAKAILCEGEGDKPCNSCKACTMIDSSTHPDLITIEKENNLIKIDVVREKLVKELSIKPYMSEHKIVIIDDADYININGQNAILKSIEEPPSYATIILICENLAALLHTIKSRCLNIRFNSINEQSMEEFIHKYNLPGSKQKIYTKLAEGSIGSLVNIVEDEEYLELRKNSIDYLERLYKGQILELYNVVQEVAEQKAYIDQILKFWLLWFRDVMIVKTTDSKDLYFIDYINAVTDNANKFSYTKLSKVIEQIKQAIIDVKQNINITFILENLLLTIKK